MPDHLGAQQPAGGSVPGQADVQFFGAWIVGLVIPGRHGYGIRVKSGLDCLFVLQARAGGHAFKDLDRLGAKAALIPARAACHVFTGHASLFVGGGAQGQVYVAIQNAMPGLRAIAGSPDIGSRRGHGPVNNNGIPGARADAGGLCQGG